MSESDALQVRMNAADKIRLSFCTIRPFVVTVAVIDEKRPVQNVRFYSLDGQRRVSYVLFVSARLVVRTVKVST